MTVKFFLALYGSRHRGAAKAIDPKIADTYAGYGMTP